MGKNFKIGVIMILFLAIIVFAGPLIAPYDPNDVNMSIRLQGVTSAHIMGTDQLGRDLFSRLVYATGTSVKISLVVVIVSMVIGFVFGSTAAFLGGAVDEFLMRIIDVFMAFPTKIFTIAIAGILGASAFNITLALIITSWAVYARMVRGCVLTAKEMPFIDAATALGANRFYTIIKHVLPSVFQPLSTFAFQRIAHTMMAIVGLSFIGLGVQPPTPELGAMISESKNFMSTAPHLFIFPGLLISYVVFSFNILDDSLRDYWDPRIKSELAL
ncbi:ABC transporter permease [Acetobacterium paludosum]|nr:ABC transporter permease [Acetobacterium paludosum]